MPAATAAADIVIPRTAVRAATRAHPPAIPALLRAIQVPPGAPVLPATVRAREAVLVDQAVRVTAPVPEGAREVPAIALVPAAGRADRVVQATLTVREAVQVAPAVPVTVPRPAVVATTLIPAAEKVTAPARLRTITAGEATVRARATARAPVFLQVPRRAPIRPVPGTRVRHRTISHSTAPLLARARRKPARTPSRIITIPKSRRRCGMTLPQRHP